MTGDELWLAVKFQTNLEIAGSPRNSFRTSVGYEFNGGKALNGLGGDKLTEPYQTKNVIVKGAGVRQRQLSAVVKRETAQIYS